MDLERVLASSWNSSSSSPSFSSASSSRSSSSSTVVAVVDRIELEAAEALADLAHSATRESCGGDSASQWGSKGKRAKKRVKSESPAADPFFDAAPPRPSRFSPDRIVANQQLCETICINVELDPAKVEPDGDLPKSSPRCAKSYLHLGGGRSRQNLTEAEKEERRLRRILANRESARQTIRRRQALCEELTRKAADLAWENQNLRGEMESALKEYQSLQTTNKHLKAQLFKAIKTEAEESPAALDPGPLEIHGTPSTNCPLLIYNQHPFSQFCWLSVLPSLNPAQSHHGPPHAIVIPSNIPMPVDGELDSCQEEKETCINVNGTTPPLYLVPGPWFFPLPDHGDRLHPQHSFSLKHVQNASSMSNQVSSSTSSGVATFKENGHSSVPVKVKSEGPSSSEVRVYHDLGETPTGLPADEVGQCGVNYPKEMIPNFVARSPVKNDSRLHSVCASIIPGICSKSGHSAPPEKNQDPFKFQIKKLLDATAATEARRRRKELTKLKNLHGRQCRTNC